LSLSAAAGLSHLNCLLRVRQDKECGPGNLFAIAWLDQIAGNTMLNKVRYPADSSAHDRHTHGHNGHGDIRMVTSQHKNIGHFWFSLHHLFRKIAKQQNGILQGMPVNSTEVS